MGQRLVIYVNDGDEPKCAIYYHWSAYFKSAVAETTKVCQAIMEAERNNKDVILSIERMLEEQAGGIRNTEEDIEYVKEHYPTESLKLGSRNRGIMTMLKSGIESFEAWSEGDVYIDLKTRKIDFGVFLDPEPFEIGSNFTQSLGDAGVIIDTMKKGSGYVRREKFVCSVDVYNDLTIENIEDLYAFLVEYDGDISDKTKSSDGMLDSDDNCYEE